MKRVALIGNMNNNFFAITRHLRDLGYDAHLFYRLGMEHFQPKADCYTDSYVSYCHEVNWLDNGICNISEEQIMAELTGFQFYIGQGDEAAAAYRAGIQMDVYFPYGSDVYKYAQLQQEFSLRHKLLYYIRTKDFRVTRNMLRKGTPAKSMRGAITTAKYILVDHTNKDFEDKLKLLEYNGRYENVPMPFIYDKQYEDIYLGTVDPPAWNLTIDKAREDYQLLILYHGRQEWKSNYNEFTPKNTHHLIIGFANYIKQSDKKKACLIMLEYGYDLHHSKQLIHELGIEEHVIWLPKMFRKEIMYLISKVDVCSGEFGRSYLTFGTIVEAMTMRRPVIHYRDDSIYQNAYSSLYPLLNAKEPHEITEAIEFAVNNPGRIREIGEEASEWIKSYFIENPLRRLRQLIESSSYINGNEANDTTFSKI